MMRDIELTAFVLAVSIPLGCAGGAAEPLPRPSVDYQAEAHGLQGASIRVAHHAGQIRLDITTKKTSGDMIGLIDMAANRMIMIVTVPGLDTIGVDMELPDDYPFTDPDAEGIREGSDTVAGEACDLWRLKTPAAAGTPIQSCITADGILLRTSTSVMGKPSVVYEVSSLERVAQDPARFAPPAGVRITRLSGSLRSLIPGFGQ